MSKAIYHANSPAHRIIKVAGGQWQYQERHFSSRSSRADDWTSEGKPTDKVKAMMQLGRRPNARINTQLAAELNYWKDQQTYHHRHAA